MKKGRREPALHQIAPPRERREPLSRADEAQIRGECDWQCIRRKLRATYDQWLVLVRMGKLPAKRPLAPSVQREPPAR
jgi:hypothetical protein